MNANGVVNLFVELLAALDIVRSEPAADTVVLEITMETVSEWLIFGAEADEA